MIMKDEYFFLSNFYPCDITLDIDGKICRFKNVEAAFQAQKNPEIADRWSQIKGLEAKKLGKNLIITKKDWDKYQIIAMTKALYEKFKHIDLLIKLQKIDGDIVEENYWHDTFWGTYKGEGKNILGKLLTNIKDNNNDPEKLLNYADFLMNQEL